MSAKILSAKSLSAKILGAKSPSAKILSAKSPSAKILSAKILGAKILSAKIQESPSEVGLQSYASCIKVISIGFRVALFKENTVALLEKQ